MAYFLKKDTAVTVLMGPFVDSTDAVTPEEGLTISPADVKLSKNGGAAAAKSDTNNESHVDAGLYTLQLNATDTNTLGQLVVFVEETGAVANYEFFQVIPADVYDSLFGGTNPIVDTNGRVDVGSWLGTAVTLSTNNNPDVNINEIGDDASVPAVLVAALLGGQAGTFSGTPSTTSMATGTSGFDATDDHYNGRRLVITSGSGKYQATDITDYTGSTTTFTVTAVATAPASGDSFVVL